MVPPVSNVEPNCEVIGMKAVVLNSMGYSLSLRCSFARACLGIPTGCGGLDLRERGVHEISTMVYVNAQFGVPVSHRWGCRVPRYKARSQKCPTQVAVHITCGVWSTSV
jgi:hypothetical protein